MTARGHLAAMLATAAVTLVGFAVATAPVAAAPPPSKQVVALKRQVAALKKTVAVRTKQRDALQDRVTALTEERDRLVSDKTTLEGNVATLLIELARVRQLIVDSVQNLANAWRSDGNPKTEVSYYQGSGDYWSYTFTWCGFCS